MRFLRNIPFTYHWIVRRTIGKDVKTILDLGCGNGDFMSAISAGESWQVTGVELHTPSVDKARKRGIYKKVIQADVTQLPRSIFNKKFDVVFASQVLEHLPKADGQKALEKWESLSKKRIVVSTPVGFIEYDPIEHKKENNRLQKHLSGWDPEEFVKKGYRVVGQGARFIYSQSGLARKFPKFLPVFSLISFLFAPFVYFFPNSATYMIAWKEK